jgi:hypothetical protein
VSYSFNLGFHRDPWIYINAQNIYARRVNTVCIRDVNVRRDLEHSRVIIRGRPIVDPRRVKDAPRLATELHNVAQDRRDFRLDPVDPARRLPFRENERQKLVEQNRKHLRGGQESPGTPVVRGGGVGRPVSVMPTDRRVTVPRVRGDKPAAGNPGDSSGGSGAPSSGYDRRQGRGGAPDNSRQPVAPRREPLRQDSQPERVIPRIIPRPGSGAEQAPDRRPNQIAPRGNERRQDPQARPTPAPPRQNAAPGQQRPRGGEAARPAPPRQERPKQNGNGGNNGGGNKGGGNNGGGHKHKD